MKRIIAVLLTYILIFACAGGSAEATYDISDLSLEELYELRLQLDDRIAALESAYNRTEYPADGYLVGEGMPAGDYVLMENDGVLFASVSVHVGGTAEGELKAYALINHQAMVHLDEGMWVTLTGATAYPMENAPAQTIENGTVYEGAYLVGEHIPGGEYTVFTVDKAPLSSYSVYDDILGRDAALVCFEVIDDDTVIRLEEGNYVELSGCMLSIVQ